MFKALFGRNSAKTDPHLLYGRVVARARATDLYERLGVPDTLDGRFEMMAMHVYLVLRRLRLDANDHKGFSQALFDTFIDDISAGLREAGVGDQTVPKRLQKMSRVFYGRVKAWDADFEAEDAASRLNQTFKKNLYPDDNAEINLEGLVRYVIEEDARIAALSAADIIAGRSVFSDPVAASRKNANV